MKNWSEFTCFQTSSGAVWGGLFLTTDANKSSIIVFRQVDRRRICQSV